MAADSSSESSGNLVAVVGLAGRFPGARTSEALWRNLSEGRESIRRFSADELRESGTPETDLSDPTYVMSTGWLDDALAFDAEYFNYSPLEAGFTDPQHRIFLECAVEALDDAGCVPNTYPGAVGVFGGASMNIQQLTCAIDENRRTTGPARWMLLFGNDKDYLTTRVSYKLNLTGPSVNVQSACSTSLLAVHLACQSLLAGECDVALAGGVSILSSLYKEGYRYTDADLLSPDGRCRPFDAAARGTVFGDGVGVVVLKPLDRALQDGDRIRAVIRGSAANNDGADKLGFSAPSAARQAAVIAEAIAVAGVQPSSISFVEAHGTGTELGDPLEVAGLATVIRKDANRTGPCVLGSIKGNVGHLGAAAGIAGLIKTILALEAEEIPPTANFASPNPRIDFSSTPFVVNDRSQPWPRAELPRLAGVSSFGIGGTNVHVVVEEAPLKPLTPSRRSRHLLTVSARREDALEIASGRLADHLRAHPELPLEDVAHTLVTGRARHRHVRSVICGTTADAIEGFSAPHHGRMIAGERPSLLANVAFMFPGQGAQRLRMGASAYQEEALYRAAFDSCAEILLPLLQLDLRDLLFNTSSDDPAADATLTRTEIAQPALFSVHYALSQFWLGLGVRPSAMIGHSLGELSAACVAGVFTLEDGLRVVTERGRIMQAAPTGGMLAVQAAADEVRDLLPASLEIAAVNASGSCVVSGPDDAIQALVRRLESDGHGAMRLRTSHAFHSRLMAPAAESFTAFMSRIPLRPTNIPVVSNVTGTWLQPEQATDPQYWGRQLREPVQFEAGLSTLLAGDDVDILLEAGPGQALTNLARAATGLQGRTTVISSLPRGPKPRDDESLLDAVARMDMAGAPVSVAQLYEGETRSKVSLPPYPFQRRDYALRDLGVRNPHADQAAPLASADGPILYVPSWRRAPFVGSATVGVNQTWAIFTLGTAFSRAIVDELRAAGQIVFTIDPAASITAPRQSARDAIATICERHGAPDQVLYLWGLEPSASAAEPLLCDLVDIVKTMSDWAFDKDWGLTAISCNAQNVRGNDVVHADGAVLLGPCHCLAEEVARARGRYIDVDALDLQPGPAGRLASRLAFDLLNGGHEDCAYRDDRRWIRALDPLPRRRVDAADAQRVDGGFKPGGVYVITGGLGGIGLAVAGALFGRYQARLVLVGRTPLPPRLQWDALLAQPSTPVAVARALSSLRDLEAQGAEVLVVSADIGEAADAARLVKDAKARFGRIDGLLHAAGVAGGGMFGGHMAERTDESIRSVLHPKVLGSTALAGAFASEPIELVVLFSSISALFGYVGLADYAAANAVLDSLAQGGVAWAQRVVAINWDSWNEVGMALAADANGAVADLKADWLKAGLGNKEATEALFEIVASDETQVFVTKAVFTAGPWPAARKLNLGGRAVTTHSRPDLSNLYVAPRTANEEAAARILADMLGIDRVGIDDNFLDLGCHSLMATQFTSRMRAETGQIIPIRLFFEALTIRGVMEGLEDLEFEEFEI
jgi:phthiocerol/phenolphthiocerol synthesis type-I polyketide synthase E